MLSVDHVCYSLVTPWLWRLVYVVHFAFCGLAKSCQVWLCLGGSYAIGCWSLKGFDVCKANRIVMGICSFFCEFCVSSPACFAGGSAYLGGGDGILQALKGSAPPGSNQLSSLGPGGYVVPSQQTMQGVALGQMSLQVR
jgi:hypothetical protein